MKVNRLGLLEALNKVKPGLDAAGSAIEQGNCFVFCKDYIFTFNDSVAVRIPFKTGITGAVPSSELLAFVNRVGVDDLDIKMVEGVFRATGTRVKVGIHSETEIHLPLDEIIIVPPIDEFIPLPKNFLNGVRMTVDTAGKNTNSQALESVHILDSIMESCDNFRLTVFDLSAKWEKESLIPARSLVKILAYDPVSYGFAEDWVHFYNEDGCVISIRPVNEAFEELSSLIGIKGTEVVFPKDLEQALSDAAIFLNQEAEYQVKVELSKNKITVTGEGDIGWLEEIVRFKYSGENISFQMNPTFLIGMLGVLENVIIGDSMVEFVGTDCAHVVSLEG
jgi:hypothetical protein